MNPSTGMRYRSRAIANSVIGFSVSYERKDILARGLGVEHVREMLLRLARLVVRQGASLAFGGNWRDTEDNFTFDLLRLISAEQEDNSLGGPDTSLCIGRLYNHVAWPYYLETTPHLEAQWINCCRIVRITQSEAGFTDDELASDTDAAAPTPRAIFNRAVTLSVMRRKMLQSISLEIIDGSPEAVPPVVARVALGGKLLGFSGMMPGIFEEALTTLEQHRPLYLLGGFGGATAVLTQAILNGKGARPKELTPHWYEQNAPAFMALSALFGQFRLPPPIPTIPDAFNQLWDWIERARANPAAVLHTGLDDAQTRELLATRDLNSALRLVRQGLTIQQKLPPLAA